MQFGACAQDSKFVVTIRVRLIFSPFLPSSHKKQHHTNSIISGASVPTLFSKREWFGWMNYRRIRNDPQSPHLLPKCPPPSILFPFKFDRMKQILAHSQKQQQFGREIKTRSLRLIVSFVAMVRRNRTLHQSKELAYSIATVLPNRLNLTVNTFTISNME